MTLHIRRKNLTSSLHSSMRSFLSLPFRLPLFLSLSLSSLLISILLGHARTVHIFGHNMYQLKTSHSLIYLLHSAISNTNPVHSTVCYCILERRAILFLSSTLSFHLSIFLPSPYHFIRIKWILILLLSLFLVIIFWSILILFYLV